MVTRRDEQISNDIANCLQFCNLINKALHKVYAVVPQLMEQMNDITNNINYQDQQQQTKIPNGTMATKTSNPKTAILHCNINQEIEELFTEATKELENNNNNKMEPSTSSNFTEITQIERVFQNLNESAMSDATIVGMNSSSLSEKHFKDIATSQSMRSLGSSIEIHDGSSVLSDDSHDWTIMSQDELFVEPIQRNVDPKTGAIPKNSYQVDVEIQKDDSIKSVSIENQTSTSILSGNNQQELEAPVEKSPDIEQKSIENIHKSIETSNFEMSENSLHNDVPNEQSKSVDEKEVLIEQAEVVIVIDSEVNMRQYQDSIYQNEQSTAQIIPETSKSNTTATIMLDINEKPQQKLEPPVIAYDPNPKINSAVYTMMKLGFSNEGSSNYTYKNY